MDKGFIMLNRKFFSNRMWKAARVFSECEAWLDLIQSARFDATPLIENIGDLKITYSRGQYPASIRFLSKKWQWGEQRVRTFLNELKKEGSITTDSSQGMNIITLCKYDRYNSVQSSENTANNTGDNTDISLIIKELHELKTQVIAQQITQGQHTDNTNNKKVKNIKKEGNKETLSIESEKKDSIESSHPQSDFEKFNLWLKKNAPYCADTKNFTTQISEKNLSNLKKKYNSKQIAEIILQIENRKDLRKRYSDLYRTVLNWIKRENQGK